MKLTILFPFLFSFFSHGFEKQEKKPEVISCGYRKITRATISSVQSGNWSDPTTWGGTIPSSTDLPKISTGHIVYADTSVTIAGMEIEGKLSFVPTKSVTIQSTKNIVVTGTLEAITPNPLITQIIKFTGINETNFVGGGMDVLTTDVGLWVMGSGKLNLEGAYRTPFVNADTSIATNATSIKLKASPTGWRAGDELTIAPTTNGSKVFDETTIQTISQNQLTVASSVGHSHPKINNSWTAEVINLTRNIRIEGTATGRTHVFIRSTVPQSIKNVQLRYVGPRKQQSGDAATEFILGRYGFHFHHCMSGSVGSLVDGCVIRDAGSHAYVPHVSDGITMSHNIAYNVLESAFWWDFTDPTHNTKWIGNIVANVNFIEQSIGIDTEGTPTFGTNGFVLGIGDDNICDSNVVVAQYTNNDQTNSAYDWEEVPGESVWQFVGNIAHNCDVGLRSWQNNEKVHIIESTTIYNCPLGVLHGAYVNNYTYKGGSIYNAVFEDHAASDDYGVRIEDMTLDGGGLINYPFHMVDGNGTGIRPVLVRNCTLKGGTLGAIFNESDNMLKNIDFIQCSITGTIKVTSTIGETVRVQPITGQSYQVKASGTTNISAFAPTSWGTGKGLKAEYFNNVDFTSPALTRTEPVVMFKEWWDRFALPGSVTGVHHLITDDSYSVRFTGYIEPQYTENYVFKVDYGGGVRLYVNNNLIINKWFEAYPNTYTSTSIALQAGQKYAIRLEYFNDDNNTQLLMYWQSTTLPKEIVPQSQLYTDTTGTPPPSNQAPTANAGSDVSIQLPTSSVNLSGSGSSDADGTISTYAWTKVSGPSTYTITNPNSVSTSITGLVQGTYTFRLTVTDNNGATATDDVVVTVAPANIAPTANAGSDVVISLPTNSTSLNGSGSSDADGTISTYAWSKVSGPSSYTIANPSSVNTNVTGLAAGTYVFRLTVTDNNGATAYDDVTVKVNQPPVSNAGLDVSIQLPTSSVNLSGSGSSDADGTISTYAWTKVSGPSTYTITNPNSVSTSITGLVQGTYTFRLTVTDNNGATSYDDVVVVVQPANLPPVANAGNDETINLQFTLSGTGTDSDGSIVSYLWEKVSGPSCTIVNPNQNQTTVNQLSIGVYVFRLTVTDNQGATATSTVTKTIQ